MTLSDRVNSAPAGLLVSFPPGVTEWTDFIEPGLTDAFSGRGLNVTNPGGLIGSGVASTTLQMTASSTTKFTDMMADDSGLHYVWLAGMARSLTDLTVQGQSIGNLAQLADGTAATNNSGDPRTESPYVYHGVTLYEIADVDVRNVKIAAIPGAAASGVGETHTINSVRAYGSMFTNVELDGASIGATGLGLVQHSGVLIANTLNCHHFLYGQGIGVYGCQGIMELTNYTAAHCASAVTLRENIDGLVFTLRTPTFTALTGPDLIVSSTLGSAEVTLYDPVPSRGDGKIAVSCPATVGSATNLQQQSDIRVFASGVDVSSSVLLFV